MTNTRDIESVLIFDFGSQYAQLIARRVREQNVFCQLVRANISAERVRELKPSGIILSGGPSSSYEDGAPRISAELFELGAPVLGICYGAQLTALMLGGKVVAAASLVDRSNGSVDLGVPFFPLIRLDVPSYEPDALPPELAAIPAIKPGIRAEA